MKLLRSAVMLCITFMAALTLAVPCAAAAQTWVYDSSAQTLTLQGTAVVINNVTTSGAGTLTIGSGNGSFANTEIDLTTIVDAGNQPYTVTLIDDFAFGDQINSNNSIKSVTAPHVKTVGESAFSRAKQLQTVNMPSLELLKQSAFYDCSSLKTVILPKLKLAGITAFSLCSSLEEIKLESAEEIISGAFRNCSSLKSIALPKVKTIYSSAFADCSALKTLTLGAPPTVDADVFQNLTLSNITIKVPADQVEAYKGNSAWNTFVTGGLKLEESGGAPATPDPVAPSAPVVNDTSTNTPAGKNVGFMDKVNTSVSQNSSLQMRVNKDVSEFLCVIVDGAVVPASNYTVKSGSTIVTLTPQYLSTLTVGNHAVRLVFLNNDYAETDFTIDKKSAVPQTGDTAAMSLGLLCIASLATAYITRRKKNSTK